MNLYVLQESELITLPDLERVVNLEFTFGISAEDVFQFSLEAIELAKAEILSVV